MVRIAWRTFVVLAALAGVILGLAGTYSYGEAYWQHRGFPPVRRLPRARLGRLLTVHFHSAALHRRSDYLVYLPPGYSPRRHYPVYYLLHGAPGNPQDFISVVNLNIRLSNRVSEHELRPMILVMPDGRPGGSTFFDSEWANTRAGPFETYILNVVHDVDRRFTAIRSRQGRVIAGYSAGGYGALNIALHHPAVFGNVQSWSGYFRQRRKCCRAFAHATPAELAYNSPLDYARMLPPGALTREPLRVYMFTGRQDPDGRGIGAMAHALRRVGAVASYNLYPGGHDWRVWYERVDSMMLLASQMVGHPLRPVARPSTRPGSRTPETGTGRPGGASQLSVRRQAARAAEARHGLPPLAWLGLVLAVASAALINLGFLLQQRGLVHGMGDGVRAWARALRSRAWLAGQAIGWLGFALQMLSVALAPLSLVQAFAAGGLALTVPLAAGLFGHRVPRLQVMAVMGMAAGLAVLSLGVPRPGAGMSAAALLTATGLGLMASAAVSSIRSAAARAAGAGLAYGVGDAAIKAVSVGVRAHGASGLVSGWTLVAAGSTFAGFVAFQAALRRGNGVSVISLMTVLTTLTALVFGLAAFRESLGTTTATTILHVAAIALVLGCVPVLLDTRFRVSTDRHAIFAAARRGLGRAARLGGATAGVALATIAAVLTGTGLLYGLRGLGWVAAGPRLGDALPLLQLAGFDGQPLARVAAAWLLAGAVLGLALVWIKPAPRVLIAGGLGLVLLLLASEASFALARNLRFTAVIAGRMPGAGAWIAGLLLALGLALPRPFRGRLRIPQAALRPLLRVRHQLSSLL